MQQFYGDRWSKQFINPFQIDLYKTMWFNGLVGLSYDQIRHGLAVCKKHSRFNYAKPPHAAKFFHFCMDIPYPGSFT